MTQSRIGIARPKDRFTSFFSGRHIVLAVVLLGLYTPQEAQAQFADDFSRPDGTDIGNGWIEKSTQAFQISSGEAAKLAVGSGYRDNLVYRPATEDLLDVEASVELRLTNASPGYPQIFARLQSDTVSTFGQLDGYILYIPNNVNRAVLGRQCGRSFVTTLATITLSEALTTQGTYRLELGVSGTTSVSLSGFVEHLTPSGYTVIGQATYEDTSSLRMSTPGMSGVSGHIEQSYNYDNFRDRDL